MLEAAEMTEVTVVTARSAGGYSAYEQQQTNSWTARGTSGERNKQITESLFTHYLLEKEGKVSNGERHHTKIMANGRRTHPRTTRNPKRCKNCKTPPIAILCGCRAPPSRSQSNSFVAVREPARRELVRMKKVVGAFSSAQSPTGKEEQVKYVASRFTWRRRRYTSPTLAV